MPHPQQDYDPIKMITSTVEWLAIESEMEKYMSEMFDLRLVDEKLSAVAYKTECLARRRAAENLLEFYKTHKFTKKTVGELRTTFR